MAVGLERAHAELLGQGEGLAVMGGGLVDGRGSTMRGDVAEEAQGIRLDTLLLVRTGERQRILGEGMGLLQTASHEMRLPQGKTTECLIAGHCRGNSLFHRLREQWHSIGNAPTQSIRRTQGPGHPGEIDREVSFLTDAHGPFESGEYPGQVALAQGQQTDPPRGHHEARGVIHDLGNPHPFVPGGTALGKRTQLGMAPGEHGTRVHGRHDDLTEALAALRPIERRHSLPEGIDRPPILALGVVG